MEKFLRPGDDIIDEFLPIASLSAELGGTVTLNDGKTVPFLKINSELRKRCSRWSQKNIVIRDPRIRNPRIGNPHKCDSSRGQYAKHLNKQIFYSQKIKTLIFFL